MSYQAVIRNASGELVNNQSVGVQISILQGGSAATAVAVYTETHQASTNKNGLLTLEIGSGSVQAGAISAINWSSGNFYVKSETDPAGGTNYSITGTSPLLATPYAFYAKEVENKDDADADPDNEIQSLSLNGSQLTISDGNTVILPSSGGSAGDNWGTQTASSNATLEGNGLAATPLKIAQQGATNNQVLQWNGTTWMPGNVAVDDADADPDNEIQSLSLNGSQLTISDGNTVTLPSSGGTAGDNWGTQTASSNATLEGNGLAATPLKIAQQGAVAKQALKWNGKTWVPGNDEIDDDDADPDNEIQSLRITGDQLSISKGNTVTLPGTGGSSLWTANGDNIYFNNGNVGIGTDTPLAPLHVEETDTYSGNVIFKSNDNASYFDPPVTGSGARMMWYAGKRAFRAGAVLGSEWDSDNVGVCSIAVGWSPKASGAYSVAMGGHTLAKGRASVAMGASTEASGLYSTAMGANTIAPSCYETAIGRLTSNYTPNSTDYWSKNDRIFSVGNGTDEYKRSNALTILKNGNTGIGTDTPTALLHLADDEGEAVFKEGKLGVGTDTPTALLHLVDRGEAVFKEGKLGVGTDTPAALLHLVDAKGEAVFKDGKLGVGTTSPAEELHLKNSAGGAKIRLEGNGTRTSTIGFYSDVTYKGSMGYQADDDYLFIYHNANVVFKDGCIGLGGINNPTNALHLPNSTVHKKGSAQATAWYTYSDGRLKSERQALVYGLPEIMQMKPVAYFHHNSTVKNKQLQILSEGKNNIGFIAQDMYKIIPEVVGVPQNEATELWSMDYEKLVPVLVKAMQEQQTQIEQLKSEKAALAKANGNILSRIEKLEALLEMNLAGK